MWALPCPPETVSHGLYLVHQRQSHMGFTLSPRDSLTWALPCPPETVPHRLCLVWHGPTRHNLTCALLYPPETISHGLYLVHQRQSHLGSTLSISPPETISHGLYLVWHDPTWESHMGSTLSPRDSLTWAIPCLTWSPRHSLTWAKHCLTWSHQRQSLMGSTLSNMLPCTTTRSRTSYSAKGTRQHQFAEAGNNLEIFLLILTLCVPLDLQVLTLSMQSDFWGEKNNHAC